MKTYAKHLLTALVLLAPAIATAQMQMGLSLGNTSYIRQESIRATVTIQNQTDSMLLIGGLQESAELEFDIRFEDAVPLPRKSPGTIVGNLMIMPGESKTIEVDLTSHYNMSKGGQYLIKAKISTKNQRFMTEGTVVDVVPGIGIETIERSLPSRPGTMRIYSLVYWTRNNSDHLFLVVTDSEKRTSYGVYDLGRLIRFVNPVLTVDISGNITVVHQSDANAMVHSYLQSVDEGVIFLKNSVETTH